MLKPSGRVFPSTYPDQSNRRINDRHVYAIHVSHTSLLSASHFSSAVTKAGLIVRLLPALGVIAPHSDVSKGFNPSSLVTRL